MTRQEIKDQLSARLNTPAWDKAKNSLVGQELLAWGAEVIFAMQSQRYALEDIYNNVIADMSDIIRLSNSSIPTVQLTDPSFAVVDVENIWANGIAIDKYPNNDFGEDIAASSGGAYQVDPYALYIKSGSTVFYNIDYLYSPNATYSGSIKFYQGTPQLYYYTPNTTPYLNYAATEPNIQNRTKINFLECTWAEDGIYSHYVNIGKNVLVDSIRIYLKSPVGQAVYLMHIADPLEIGESDTSYRIYINNNGDYNIVFGNGVNGVFVSDTMEFYITFLRLTDLDAAVGSMKMKSGYDSSFELNLGSYPQYVFQYRTENFNSVEKAQIDINKKIAQRQALTTQSQIRNYLKGFPEIIDANIGTPSPGTTDIPIHIVTASGSLSNVSYILELLNQRVSLVYVLSLDITPTVKITISSAKLVDGTAVSSSQLASISNLLSQKYGRDSIVYGQTVYCDQFKYDVKEDLGIALSSITWSHKFNFYTQNTTFCYFIGI